MIDKFQKLFGPNPPRKGAVHTSSPMEDMDLGAEDEEHRKQIARLKNKRRLIGLLAIVAAVAVVAVVAGDVAAGAFSMSIICCVWCT